MTLEDILQSISTKVWCQSWIKLTTPVSAIRFTADCTKGSGSKYILYPLDILQSISTKVWCQSWIKLSTPVSAIRFTADCVMGSGTGLEFFLGPTRPVGQVV